MQVEVELDKTIWINKRRVAVGGIWSMLYRNTGWQMTTSISTMTRISNNMSMTKISSTLARINTKKWLWAETGLANDKEHERYDQSLQQYVQVHH